MKEIFMPIGIAGIGKTTILNKLAGKGAHPVISSDGIRLELTGSECNRSRERDVWPIFHQRFREALTSRHPKDSKVFLDAVFIREDVRKKYLDLIRQARRNGQQIVLHVLEFPRNPGLALLRQKGRERQVEEDVIRQMSRDVQPFSVHEAHGIKTRVSRVDDSGSLRPVSQGLSLIA